MASTKQMQERAKAHKDAKAQYVKKPALLQAGFFYSPTDSANNVLSIICGGGPDCTFPLEIAELMCSDEYVKVQDDVYKKDPTLISDYYKQLDYVLNIVLSANPQEHASDKVKRMVATMIGNIYWLTERGFLMQSAYNGTQFAHIGA